MRRLYVLSPKNVMMKNANLDKFTIEREIRVSKKSRF